MASDRVMFVLTLVTATIQDITIKHGNVTGSGGGLFLADDTDVTMSNVTITNNNSTDDGGGIYFEGTNSGSTLNMTNCVISNNVTADLGGGMFSSNEGTINITNTFFDNNAASNNGGGILVNTSGAALGTYTYTNCSFQFNGATNDGGGLSLSSGIHTLKNCTVYNNTAGGNGGGLRDPGNQNNIHLYNCTFASNTATSGNGGGIFFTRSGGGSSNMTNTLAANNTANGSANDVYFSSGTLATNQTNLVENCASTSSCPTFSVTADPNLQTATSCNGLTYLPILLGSSAQDVGTDNANVPKLDMCGRSRIGDVDIGAYEHDSTYRMIDSLALVSFFISTDSANWSTKWELWKTMDNWTGVTIQNDRVTILSIPSNNLGGSISADLNLDTLRWLSLVNNNITGGIPNFTKATNLQTISFQNNSSLGGSIPTFSNLTNLKKVFFNNCGLTGTIPSNLASFSNLAEVYLHDNNLSGNVPEFTNLSSLTIFDIANNSNLTGSVPKFTNCTSLNTVEVNGCNLDSVPNLSALTSITTLKLEGNQFTFDDIKPNFSLGTPTYNPQDSFYTDTTIQVIVGNNITVHLGIDEGIGDNSYQWYKGGVADGAPLTTPYRTFNSVSAGDFADYHVQVTNTTVTGLTLYSREITLQNQCPTITLTPTPTNITCNGLTNGSIDLAVSGGTSPYTYNWDNGAGSNEDPTGLGVNTYSVTVTDNVGCTANTSASITEPTAISTSTSATNAICNGDNNGSIDLTVSGGTSPYTYSWDNGAGSNEDPSSLTANTYNVTVTDNNGCTKMDNETVGEPTAISLSTSVTNVTVNGASDGSIDLTVSGGSGGYTYNWDNGAGSSQDPSGLAANTYSVTVTDGASCTANTSATVTEPNSLVLSSTETDVTCNGGSNGSIDLTVSGGISPYTYAWDNGAGSSQDPSGLAANTYTVTVTDNNSATATRSITISEPAAIVIAMSISQQITCTGNANVLATPSGGSGGGYTYQWSSNTGNQTTQEATNLTGDTYTVTVMDGSGCTSNNSIVVTDISDRCRDSLTLVDLYNTTNGVSWTTNWNLNNPINTWHGITVNGNNSVTHIDLSGNNLQGEIPISMNSLSNLQSLKISNNNIIALAFLTPLISQNLTQLHVDNNLLTFDDITKNISVTDYQYNPQKTIDESRSDTVALGDFYYLQAQIDHTVTNNTYEWFKNGSSIGTTSVNQNLLSNIQNNDAGTYTYQVTNASVGGLTLTSNPIQLLVVDAGSDTTVCEATGSFNLWATPIGGTWSGTGITNASNGTFDPTTAGVGQHLLTYTVNGSSDFRQVTVFPLPLVEAGSNQSFCDGTGDVTLTGYTPSGGTWSGTGITNSANGIFNTNIAGLGTHTLTYSYTDPNTNCTATDQITVSVTTGGSVNITQGDTLKICVSDGISTLTTDVGGGIWSGTGVNAATGVFDPSLTGTGQFVLT